MSAAMNVIQHRKNLVVISRLQTLRIFLFSCFWGALTIVKQFLLSVLRLTKFDCNYIDNPPSCLVDNNLGYHSYVKIKGRGIKLHYTEAGPKDRPAVLLLHGFPDCWISWFNQIPELAKHFRVIALDLKGFGDSDKPSSRNAYKLEILLDELTIFLSSLGISRCAIIGHDIGALLGFYLAHTNADLVSKFVAISCIHPNIYWTERPKCSMFNQTWIQLSQLPFLPELDALKNDLALIDKCYKHLKDVKGGEDYIQAYKYSFSRKEDWTGPLNYFRNLPFYRLDEQNLRELDVRCLLITGKSDESILLESLVRSTEYIRTYFLKVIDDAGHYPHQENPEMVNAALLEFLLDPPLVRSKRNPAPSSGIFGKMRESVTSTLKYGSTVLTGVKNDPNVAVASLVSKGLSYGSKSSNLENENTNKVIQPENENAQAVNKSGNENADEAIQIIQETEDTFLVELDRKRGFSLEPVIFLLGFVGALIDSSFTNVIQAQYCSAVLGRPQIECQLIYKPKVPVPIPQEDIKTFTTTFLMARTLIEVGLPSLSALCTGPWSDKYGRKAVILSSAFGNFVRCAMYMAVINYPTLNPWYFLVCSIPFCLFGGTAFLLLGTYCYICDISTDNRTTNFLMVQCIFIIGNVAGIQIAPHLNFFSLFALATAVTFSAYSFGKQVLPESIPHRPTSLDGINPLSFKYIRDLKDVCYTQRTPKNRLRILLTVLIIFIVLIAEWGDDGIMYQFLKEKVNIELPAFNLFTTYNLCIGIFEAILVNCICTTKLKVATLNLLSFAIFLKFSSVFFTVVGYRLWHFCFVRTLNGFILLATALARSYLSTLVPNEHLGKIFGVLIPAECFAQVFASPLYVEIFNRTTSSLPEAVFLFSSLLMLSDLILAILLWKLFKNEETNAQPDLTSPETASIMSNN